MVLTKFVLKYIFVTLQDLGKETEFRFLPGLPTDVINNICGEQGFEWNIL